LEEGSARLVAAINNKKLDDIGTTEVLVTAANAKLAVLKTQLIENSENLNRLRKKNRKSKWFNCILFERYLSFFVEDTLQIFL